jgi:hypothetical protein
VVLYWRDKGIWDASARGRGGKIALERERKRKQSLMVVGTKG